MSHADIEISGSLIASLDGLAGAVNQLDRRMEKDNRRRLEIAMQVRSAPFGVGVALSGGANLGLYFAQSPNLGPAAGMMWSVRSLIAQGYTAGTVNIYRDNPNGEQFAGFPQAGLYTFGRGERPLWPMSQMVVVASGISGIVEIYGHADVFPQGYWAEYNLGFS
jgi:hypothetical protein